MEPDSQNREAVLDAEQVRSRSEMKRKRSTPPGVGEEPDGYLSSRMRTTCGECCCCCPRCCTQGHTPHMQVEDPAESSSEVSASLEGVSSESEGATDLEEYSEGERAGLAAVKALKKTLFRHETIVSLCVTLLRGSGVLAENATQTSTVEEWFQSHRVTSKNPRFHELKKQLRYATKQIQLAKTRTEEYYTHLAEELQTSRSEIAATYAQSEASGPTLSQVQSASKESPLHNECFPPVVSVLH